MSRAASAHSRAAFAVACLASLGACQSVPDASMARGDVAYTAMGQQRSAGHVAYRIGPFDRLTISVFNEPSLSFADIPVDAEGQFEYPLIGTVAAAGRTSEELTADIKRRLDRDHYNDARVTIFVNSSASQFVTVEGAVTEPGRYELPNGRATLLEVIAQAKSPTRTAKLDQVMVFRMVEGQRMGAVFDLVDIRTGAADNPALRGGDIVVVNNSAVKGAFRDFLLTAPFFNVFRTF
ncbi:polysaccharide biosynthesis/export family protein [Croceicoccus bisphenolivorans]|uniref:polysaccharide biosynthesis/export family protein n=1 Tax=Croceicoccus bisphenolivorans TaxID=1783232 RepID=UPI0008361428|nr:polysaccharide biosynthesis/export family protein [Croceicoccus bisphenolivorans]